jgi:hypothetical protein
LSGGRSPLEVLQISKASSGFRRFRASCDIPPGTSSVELENFRLLNLSLADPAGGVWISSSKMCRSLFTCMAEVLGDSSSSSSVSADIETSDAESSFSRAEAVPKRVGAWFSLELGSARAGVDSSELESEDESVPSMAIWVSGVSTII